MNKFIITIEASGIEEAKNFAETGRFHNMYPIKVLNLSEITAHISDSKCIEEKNVHKTDNYSRPLTEGTSIKGGVNSMPTWPPPPPPVGQGDSVPSLIDAYENYIKLLVEEIDELAGLAITHGWTSSRHEEGKKQREHIAKIKSKFI